METTGAGSGVEIIENRPYESNNEKGQYTLKVYHVSQVNLFYIKKKKEKKKERTILNECII